MTPYGQGGDSYDLQGEGPGYPDGVPSTGVRDSVRPGTLLSSSKRHADVTEDSVGVDYRVNGNIDGPLCPLLNKRDNMSSSLTPRLLLPK